MIYKLSERHLYREKLKDYDRIPLEHLLQNMTPTIYSHKSNVRCLAFELDGTRLLVGDEGGKIWRWKIGNNFKFEAVV
jgi:hypothetical protein